MIPSQQRARIKLSSASGLLFIILLLIGSLVVQRTYLRRGITSSPPEPANHQPLQIGLNVSLEQYDTLALDDSLREISALGVTQIKQSFYWQPADPNWESTDHWFAAAAAHNLELIPLLDGNPDNHFAPPTDPADFAAWAGEFAARYGEQVRYYIVWDEPNIMSHWGDRPVNPNEYAALLAAASNAIRTADSDAIIVLAPLAPTVETGPQNLADPLYLQRLYEVGAASHFDIVAAKPYGFNQPAFDRSVALDELNFSRVILLREVMERNQDAQKPMWAGNWGWHHLSTEWQGPASLWGGVDAATRTAWTSEALIRARDEWPWMGTMFLQHWEPPVQSTGPDADPMWGFRVAESSLIPTISTFTEADEQAFPGFHLAGEGQAGQLYTGGWRFSPTYGADISESGDRATLTFYGTDVALVVRRANFRARLHVEIDGQPANALPQDETGATLILTAADPNEDYLSTEVVARDLPLGQHTLTLVADRGWDQWALHGYSVSIKPDTTIIDASLVGLIIGAVIALWISVRQLAPAQLGTMFQRYQHRFERLSSVKQTAMMAVTALIVAFAGWSTWGDQLAGLYRRLGDVPQLALTAFAASLFYVAPSFFVYIAALIFLFILLYFRPVLGLALVTFVLPFYVLPKPLLQYQFSPVEIFTLVAFAAALTSYAVQYARGQRTRIKLTQLDGAVLAFTIVATISLFFTARVNVALNEWRVLIIESALFYATWRIVKPTAQDVQLLIIALVGSGLTVAAIGLADYVSGTNLITAEGGLMRLRSVYGSPNNVALYFDRIVPLLAALFLLTKTRVRWLYLAVLLPIGIALLLTFSKGGLLLGTPAGLLILFIAWQKENQRRAWPWIVAALFAAPVVLFAALQFPVLAARLDLQGATSFVRLNLWRSSIPMFLDHPLFGVGLDNFLYAYRGRYILQAAWREPHLNHPHNILFDFATRLGTFGLIAGGWLYWQAGRLFWANWKNVRGEYRPVAVGLCATFVASLAHGLVDHSFFLVDLAFAFYALLGIGIAIQADSTQESDLSKPLNG